MLTDRYSIRAVWAIAVLLSMQIASGAVQATESWHTGYIKTLYPLHDGTVILVFESDAAACTGSGPGKYHYITAGQNAMNAEGVKTVFATAMMAFAMGKQISMAFDNASTFCYVGRIWVSN